MLLHALLSHAAAAFNITAVKHKDALNINISINIQGLYVDNILPTVKPDFLEMHFLQRKTGATGAKVPEKFPYSFR